MSRLGNIGGRLYRGEVSFDFVSRQKLWYTISGCILVISLLALIFRGLDYSVEFKGGSVFTVPAASSVTQTGLDQVVTANGGANPTVSEVKPFIHGKAPYWQVQTSHAVHDASAGDREGDRAQVRPQRRQPVDPDGRVELGLPGLAEGA